MKKKKKTFEKHKHFYVTQFKNQKKKKRLDQIILRPLYMKGKFNEIFSRTTLIVKFSIRYIRALEWSENLGLPKMIALNNMNFIFVLKENITIKKSAVTKHINKNTKNIIITSDLQKEGNTQHSFS